MNAFWTQLDASLVSLFNHHAVDPNVRVCVKNAWPLHRLDHAVYIAAAYVTLVVACKLSLDKPKPARKTRQAKSSVAEKMKEDGKVVFVAVAVYNAVQVGLCGWMVCAALSEHRRRDLALVCNPHNLAEEGMAWILHVFYLSKVLDFADTLFMIVKGNWRQVSFLHVYHHATIFLFYWLNANVNYDADIYLTIVLNGSIHFVMYGYYAATSFNVAVPVLIKRSITNAQLIQFCCMELQGAYLLMNNCGSPRNVTILYMAYISTMLLLFLDFKRKAYSSGAKPKVAKAE